MPFLKDIEGMFEALAKALYKPKRKTARAQVQRTGSQSYTRFYADGEVSGTISGVCKRTVTVRAYCMYSIDVDLGLSHFGFTISDIPSAAWELIPFSFVVDWFAGVGNYISAITPKVGITRLSEGYTVEDVVEVTENLGTLTAVPAGYTASGGGDMASYISTTKYRVPCKLGELAGITLKPEFDFSNLFALLSLVTQKVTK